MRKVFLSLVFALVCMLTSAQTKTTKVVTDSLTFMPNQVEIFEGVTSSGEYQVSSVRHRAY